MCGKNFMMLPNRKLFSGKCLLVFGALLVLAGCGMRTTGSRDAGMARDRGLINTSCATAEKKSDSGPVSHKKANFETFPFSAGPLPKRLTDARIVINKKTRCLKLFSGDRLLRVYPVKLGVNPVDDKETQGDGRTPEGTFYICVKNPQSRYHLSLGLSYPNLEDARRGLKNNLITAEQFDAIRKRIEAGQIPPWDTPLGGEIFIHGEAEYWDWTYGCVALNNRDIEELFAVIPLGTRVEIIK